MAAFVGTKISETKDRYRIPTVTFAVHEWLWGGTAGHAATVRFSDGFGDYTDRLLLLVTPSGDGTYSLDDCGSGLYLPATHKWAQEIGQWLRQRKPARISIETRSSSYTPIQDAEVQLTGNGGTFRAGGGLIPLLRSWSAAFDLLKPLDQRIEMPPGMYRVSTNRANYRVDANNNEVTILPGSCANVRIQLAPVSQVTGRIFSAEGRPIGDNRLFLEGMARSGKGNYRASVMATTSPDGHFRFAGVMPGWYYIVTDVGGLYSASGLLVPKSFYPGVPSWRNAKQVLVEEGKSIEGIEYRLPDLGKLSEVTMQILSEDDVPVEGARVGVRGTCLGTQGRLWGEVVTDRQGRATVGLWSTCDYDLAAALSTFPDWYHSLPIRVSRGAIPSETRMVLRGLQLKKR
ncbi:MAG: carboxypeptidase-like regulatory domain-containing protein [Acidobacteriota bacterium]